MSNRIGSNVRPEFRENLGPCVSEHLHVSPYTTRTITSLTHQTTHRHALKVQNISTHHGHSTKSEHSTDETCRTQPHDKQIDHG
jgi:hypothetical protein